MNRDVIEFLFNSDKKHNKKPSVKELILTFSFVVILIVSPFVFDINMAKR